jgi:4-aminobutyrate aminotransferase-like enzyme
MFAIEFHDDRHPGGKSVAQRVAAAAFDAGLIVLTAGPRGSALRLLAPLLASADDIARGGELLERACARVLANT